MLGRPRVIVMGGSLGGLTAGLTLRDIGCDVTVLERSRTPLESRGAGIVLHSATVRYFIDNEVLALGEVSTQADSLRYVNREGAIVHEQPCNYRFTSYYTLHRGLLSAMDPDRFEMGVEVADFAQEGSAVSVVSRDGADRRCDLLVAADGIGSTARRKLLPDVRPSYAGYVGWRGTVGPGDIEARTFREQHNAITYFVGRNTHILTYPIPDFDGSVEPQRRRINFVWYVNVSRGAALTDLLTDNKGVARDVTVGPGAVQARHVEALFDAAAAALPTSLAEIVIQSREPFVQVVFDVEVTRMVFGRICLIGDAAFAIRPHAAAGTAKAAEDAWRLSAAVERARGDVTEALARWEPAQLALGRQVLERARDIGNRSQFLGTYEPGDPYLAFGLYEPGDSSLAAP
jgi:2,6-dihydroxypyridine 3-monooxygenase